MTIAAVPKRPVKRHTQLVKAILAYLAMHPGKVFAWKNNTGALPVGNRFVRYGRRGSPDILGVVKGGGFFGIECKVGRDRLSADQLEFCRRVRELGAIYIEARDVEDVKHLLEGECRDSRT